MTCQHPGFTRITAYIKGCRCAECVDHMASVTRIDWLNNAFEAASEIDRLTAERDEARRIACEMEERVGCDESGCPKCGTAREKAKGRGWDCFKENTND